MGASTPGWMVRGLAAVVVLAGLAGGLAGVAAWSISDAARTIGRDAEPSVALALRMAATIWEMNAAAVGDALTDEGGATGTSWHYLEGEDRLEHDLVEAARNVTYGEAEVAPLRALQHGLEMMEQAFTEVRGVGPGNPWLLSKRVQWASRVAREFAVPPALALAGANASVLEQRYAAYRAGSLFLGGVAFAGFGAVAAVLLAVQLWLVRRTRRMLNPALVLATMVVVVTGLWFGGAVLRERADLRTAKIDAYDSLHVLFEARAVVNAVRAEQSLWLLDPAVRAEAQAQVIEGMRQLLGPAGVVSEQDRVRLVAARSELGMTPPGVKGLLGTELGNVTFGISEQEAAVDSVLRLVETQGVIAAVQGMEPGAHAQAVGRWLSARPGGGAAVFDAVIEAIDRTIKVNQVAFDERIGGGARVGLVDAGGVFRRADVGGAFGCGWDLGAAAGVSVMATLDAAP